MLDVDATGNAVIVEV
jgi:hypothetical protein